MDRRVHWSETAHGERRRRRARRVVADVVGAFRIACIHNISSSSPALPFRQDIQSWSASNRSRPASNHVKDPSYGRSSLSYGGKSLVFASDGEDDLASRMGAAAALGTRPAWRRIEARALFAAAAASPPLCRRRAPLPGVSALQYPSGRGGTSEADEPVSFPATTQQRMHRRLTKNLSSVLLVPTTLRWSRCSTL